MIKNQNPLFLYLEKEQISIDKSEFLFQLNSHPDFPSLLAVSDTLHFFSIDNGALSVEFSEIDLLPDQFIAILRERHSLGQSYLIERKGHLYFYNSGNKSVEISKTELEKRWHGIVLLVERSTLAGDEGSKDRRLFLDVLLVLPLVLCVSVAEADWLSKLFVLLPLVGLLFSIATQKDLFGAAGKLINDFCNMTSSTSCASVIGSEKWKLFRVVNFSDLSMIFFGTQFIGYLFFLFSDSLPQFFMIQKILLACSMPAIMLSLYFQKFVEKKWCPICLAISMVIIAELVYLEQLVLASNLVISNALVLVMLGALVSWIWIGYRKKLEQLKELKDFQLRANRFSRNYEIFKNILLSGPRTELGSSPIVLGNKEGETEISIITNPFCGYCKQAHEVIHDILYRHGTKLRIRILINADMDTLEEDQKFLYRHLMSTYVENGAEAFLELLGSWFSEPNVGEWVRRYHVPIQGTEAIDAYYKVQHQWCIANDSFQTPLIFVNGYRYPKFYDRDNLKYFISDLIEDPEIRQIFY